MMENQEKQKGSQLQVEEDMEPKPFSITDLPIELQLQILSFVLAHDKPITVSGFTSTYSFEHLPPKPTPAKSTPNPIPSASTQRWNHLPLSILLTSKHIHSLCDTLLFAPNINTFAFITPSSRQWSYGRDWYWTFSFGLLDHSKGTSAAMKRISRVLFKCDGSMDNSLIGTAVDYLPSMVVLTVDFKDFWGSPSAKLEEEGRKASGLGGFGGHVVLTEGNLMGAVDGGGEVGYVEGMSPRTTTTTFPASSTAKRNYEGWNKSVGCQDRPICSGEFVSVVWQNVTVTDNGRVLKELRFSGLKVGEGNWDEVLGYGKRIAGRKGQIDLDVDHRTL